MASHLSRSGGHLAQRPIQPASKHFRLARPFTAPWTIQPLLIWSHQARRPRCHDGRWHRARGRAKSWRANSRPLVMTRAMQSKEEDNYTKTDIIVAIILAAIATLWIIAYIIIFVQSGPA